MKNEFFITLLAPKFAGALFKRPPFPGTTFLGMMRFPRAKNSMYANWTL